MRAKAIEIRWHNTKPIYSTDFQLMPPSNLSSLIPNKSHPYLLSDLDKQLQQSEADMGCGQVWRLATAGGDNLVMIWLVYPRPTIAQVNQHRNLYQSSGQPTPPTLDPKSILELKHSHPPIVEYLATLTKHQGVVNVVRFCPKAEMLASAGDDGNVLLWVLSTNPTSAAFGESAADKAYERESWRTRLMLRGPAQCELYDLAWSPCGDFLLTGDTAKTARIWNVTDGSCIKQITEHSNFVQGVAWDPLGEYIATQSSDRSMNVYSVQIRRDESGSATADVHHVAKNYKIDLWSQQTNSWASFATHHERDDHNTSSARSLVSSASIDTPADTSAPTSIASSQTPRPKLPPRTISSAANVPDSPSHRPPSQVTSNNRVLSIPPTPSSATSTSFTEDSSMQPPTEIPHHNSLSSMSTSNIRPFSRSRQSSVVSSQPMSPSPIRAIRSPSPAPPLPAIHVNEEKRLSSVLLYGDEGASAFFRRLAWSNDGSTLITPAGRWENRFNETELESKKNGKGKAKEIDRWSRRNLDSDDELDQTFGQGNGGSKENPTVFIYGRGTIRSTNGKTQVCQPLARLPGHKSSSVAIRFSPLIYRLRNIKPVDSKKDTGHLVPPVQINLGPGTSMQEIDLNKSSTSSHPHLQQQQQQQNEPVPPQTSGLVGVFNLPYRMVYAVATHDTVFVYDTQQSSPICLFNNLHFSSFTDLSWTSDGETLILSSSDGYCSLVVFEKNELGERLNEQEMNDLLPEKIQSTMMMTKMNKKESLTTPTMPSTVKMPTTVEVTMRNEETPNLGLAKVNKDTNQEELSSAINPSKKRDVDASNININTDTKDLQHLPSSINLTSSNDHSFHHSPPQKKKKRAALTYEGPVQG